MLFTYHSAKENKKAASSEAAFIVMRDDRTFYRTDQ